ncbi:hypothetical protein R1flu_021422 [Riccia fluitans]|uniref:Uncharacterized protein n=1 Tax=Riccia fluitans TaxID=41844 RepID=A0ABD1ZPB1_9MARC
MLIKPNSRQQLSSLLQQLSNEAATQQRTQPRLAANSGRMQNLQNPKRRLANMRIDNHEHFNNDGLANSTSGLDSVLVNEHPAREHDRRMDSQLRYSRSITRLQPSAT